jgi:hypothetical protein
MKILLKTNYLKKEKLIEIFGKYKLSMKKRIWEN